MLATNARSETSAVDGEALIGPNAVSRTLDAVTARFGPEVATRLRESAGVPPELPGSMIPERWFVRLVAELRTEASEAESRAILRDAGYATAAYVVAHRIPALARRVLRLLPSRLALPLLLRAVSRHAWTFAGRGEFAHANGVLTLSDAPTCRAESEGGHTLFPDPDEFGGAYYEAAFEGILSLAAPGLRVRETSCVRAGASACRFVLIQGDT